MTPNPILKVLSTLSKHNVKSLLIGGHACIIYGAAEFSRDSDDVKNLRIDVMSQLRGCDPFDILMQIPGTYCGINPKIPRHRERIFDEATAYLLSHGRGFTKA